MGSPEDEPNRLHDEGPQHRVTLTKGFWLSVTPVTQTQWQAIMGDNPSVRQGPNLPVENVTWHDCQAFCQRLSGMAGKTIRLPTEAEWEYAYRAGTQTAYYFGADAGPLGEYAWFHNNSGNQTHDVGQLKPNAWGLYDMAGNVWEWCADWYGERYYVDAPERDPQGPGGGTQKVLRGGCFYYREAWCRATSRLRLAPADHRGWVGCRVVLCVD